MQHAVKEFGSQIEKAEDPYFFCSSHVFCLCKIIISQIYFIEISFLELNSYFLVAIYPHL